MAEYAFTFGATPCLIKTYVRVQFNRKPGYIAFPFFVTHAGQSSLRPVGNGNGRLLSFFAPTEQGVLAQASEGLEQRFGPRVDSRNCADVASIRHVQVPELIEDRQASLTVVARETIKAGDYVVVTGEYATPLTQIAWPGAGAILGRALERIDVGGCGQVRNVSSKSSSDSATPRETESTQRVWAALQRYAGWLRHDRSSAGTRAAVDALGMALDRHAGPEATAEAIAKVSSEVERLQALDLRQLFRNALHDLSLTVNVPKGEQSGRTPSPAARSIERARIDMQRNESWNALLDATDAVVAALLEWRRAATPANRFEVEKATRDYMNRLSPVVGRVPAFHYEAAFQKHLDAIDRQERFLATLAGRSATDESDAALVRSLQDKSETARQVFEAAQAALQAQLTEVAERDDTNGGA